VYRWNTPGFVLADVTEIRVKNDQQVLRKYRRTFHNGIDWASFLAEAAVDALGHIDICTNYFRQAGMWNALEDKPYLVVLLDPSSRASLSIVMACAGQMASQSLQAARRVKL
jgi:hypothetical protein